MSHPIRPSDHSSQAAEPSAAPSCSSSSSTPAAFASTELVSRASRNRFAQIENNMDLEKSLQNLSIAETSLEPTAVLTHLATLQPAERKPILIFKTLSLQKEALAKMNSNQLCTLFIELRLAAQKGTWPSPSLEQLFLLSGLVVKLCAEGKEQANLPTALVGLCKIVLHAPQPMLNPEASRALVTTVLERACSQTLADISIVMPTLIKICEGLEALALNSQHVDGLARIMLFALKIGDIPAPICKLASYCNNSELVNSLIAQGDLSSLSLLKFINHLLTRAMSAKHSGQSVIKLTPQTRTKIMKHAAEAMTAFKQHTDAPPFLRSTFIPLYATLCLRLIVELIPRIVVTNESENELFGSLLDSYNQAFTHAKKDMAEAMELLATRPLETLKADLQNLHSSCWLLLDFIATQSDYLELLQRCGAGCKLFEIDQKRPVFLQLAPLLAKTLAKVSYVDFISRRLPEPAKRIAETFFVAGILSDMFKASSASLQSHLDLIQKKTIIPFFQYVAKELCPNDEIPTSTFSQLASQLLCAFLRFHPSPESTGTFMAGLGMLALSGCLTELTPPATEAFQQLLGALFLDLSASERTAQYLFALGSLWKSKLIQPNKAQEMAPGCKRAIIKLANDKKSLSPHQIRQILFFIESVEALPVSGLSENEQAHFLCCVQEFRQK